MSLQDDERRDMARELHDELGPLLFGIRANTVALQESIPPEQTGLTAVRRRHSSVGGGIQLANRRILDRLRPLYIQELGLANEHQDASSDTPKRRHPEMHLTARIDSGLERDSMAYFRRPSIA